MIELYKLGQMTLQYVFDNAHYIKYTFINIYQYFQATDAEDDVISSASGADEILRRRTLNT